MLPFQQNQANAPAPAPFNPFASMADAKLFGAAKPQPENGDYIVEITKIEAKSPNLIIEYRIVESLGGSPVGFESSTIRNMQTQGWENYLTRDLLAIAGVELGGPEAESAKRYLPAMLQAELTRAPQPGPTGEPIAPGTLVGRYVRLQVAENLDPATGQRKLNRKGKYYPFLNWSPSAKQK